MRISKLYLKIFLSFVLVLAVTEILILGLFVSLTAGRVRERFVPFIEAHTLVIRDLVEARLRLEPGVPVDENEYLAGLIDELSTLYGARVWITGENGNVLAGSFSGPVPEYPVHRRVERGHYIIHETRRQHHAPLISVPFALGDGQTGQVLFLIDRPERQVLVKPFLLGLVGIGVLIALLLLPVSRIITRPLNSLQRSVQRLSAGDLSERAPVRSRDEIGALVQTFNSMADTIERMISGTRELTANVSHELRSPLARIRVAEELLRKCLRRCIEGGDRDVCLHHLDGIRREVDEMDGLIGRILALSKLDTRRSENQVSHVNLSEILRGLIEAYTPSMHAKSVTVEAVLPKDDLYATGMPDDVKTALSCLLENAVKFTARGGGIGLTLESKDDGLLCSIKNPCPGKGEIDTVRILEPFVRAGGSKEQGYGLGLTIARKIVDNHGGSLIVEHRDSEFVVRVRLPRDV
jgi:two-component system sensor histidine kinase CpxA